MPRPHQVRAFHRDDGIGEAHHDRPGVLQREAPRAAISALGRGTKLELRNPQFGLHRPPVQCRPFDVEHAFHRTRELRRFLASCAVVSHGFNLRQVHLRKTQRGSAGIIAIQAPLAIALHHRARHRGIQVRAQRQSLRTGGEVRIAQWLTFELHALRR